MTTKQSIPRIGKITPKPPYENVIFLDCLDNFIENIPSSFVTTEDKGTKGALISGIEYIKSAGSLFSIGAVISEEGNAFVWYTKDVDHEIGAINVIAATELLKNYVIGALE